MTAHLYALGCSWTEGTDDEKHKDGWVGRLAKQLDCTYTNLGGKGDSNWLQYYNFLQQPIVENSIVIWGLSSFTRIIGSNFQTVYSGDYDKQYILKYHSDKALQLQTMVMLHSFQNYCNTINCKHLTFVSFDDIQRLDKSYELPQIYNLLDYNSIIKDTSMKDFIGGKNNVCEDSTKLLGRQRVKTSVNLKYFSKDGHPNANGYSLWADELYRRINEN